MRPLTSFAFFFSFDPLTLRSICTIDGSNLLLGLMFVGTFFLTVQTSFFVAGDEARWGVGNVILFWC